MHAVRPLTAPQIGDLDHGRAHALAGTLRDELSIADVNAVGAFRPTMRELPDGLLADATVVIDERGAVLEEAGEVIHSLEHGAITKDHLIELGTALTDGAPSTAFVSVLVGLARNARLDPPSA